MHQPLEWLYELAVGIPGFLEMAAESLAFVRPQIRNLSSSGSQLSTDLHLIEVNLTTGKGLHTPVQQHQYSNTSTATPVQQHLS